VVRPVAGEEVVGENKPLLPVSVLGGASLFGLINGSDYGRRIAGKALPQISQSAEVNQGELRGRAGEKGVDEAHERSFHLVKLKRTNAGGLVHYQHNVKTAGIPQRRVGHRAGKGGGDVFATVHGNSLGIGTATEVNRPPAKVPAGGRVGGQFYISAVGIALGAVNTAIDARWGTGHGTAAHDGYVQILRDGR